MFHSKRDNKHNCSSPSQTNKTITDYSIGIGTRQHVKIIQNFLLTGTNHQFCAQQLFFPNLCSL